jgi:hypothetical protein
LLISTQIHKFIYYKYLYFKISEFDSRSWQDVLDTTLCDFLLPLKEKFEDAKKSIRNRKSKKGRQYNDQKTQRKTMLNQKSRYEHPPTHNQLPGVQSNYIHDITIEHYTSMLMNTETFALPWFTSDVNLLWSWLHGIIVY